MVRKAKVAADRNGDSGADATLLGDNGRASGEPPALTCRGTRLLVKVFSLAFHVLEAAGISCSSAEVIQCLAPAVRVERVKSPETGLSKESAGSSSLRMWSAPHGFLGAPAPVSLEDPLGALPAAGALHHLDVDAQ